MDSAQQIWSTGVKALGRAQQESTRLFEALVKEGANVEKKTRSLASGKVNAVRGSVENRVEQVKDRAADTWDRLEKVFEERVQRALVRLGVPGRDELQALIQRVDQLNARLRDLADAPRSGKNAPAAPTATPAAKPAAAKKKAVAKAPAGAKPAVKKAAKKAKATTPAASAPASGQD
ncbi:MAG: phasin family protein [Xanthomonadaceae bacterium]|nr:phasin family protein [Xanthomonadaceae bacterium]